MYHQFNNSFKFFCFLVSIIVVSCNGEKPKPFISYYYWQSNYALSTPEKDVLKGQRVQQLYLRYFDVVYDDAQGVAKPVAPVLIRAADVLKPIVPVVFIKNKVFEQLDSTAILKMAQQCLGLLEQINKQAKIKCRAVQFDCDWTEKTQAKYFFFLKKIREKIDAHEHHSSFASMTMLTATIRLHQIKYYQKTGIPPVDKGVLMLYNMGDIATGEQSSIYESEIAKKYLPYLHKYTLRLDVALPIFSWGIQIRDGQVLALLNKMDKRDLSDSLVFRELRANRYVVQSSLFKDGFYLKQGDEIKLEDVSQDQLRQMVADLKEFYPNQVQQIIFYDLDSVNLSRYEKDFAQKIADCY